MRKCSNCGASVSETDRFCQYCGSEFGNEKTSNTSFNTYGQRMQTAFTDIKDDGSFVWGLIGFIMPMIGLILYLCWINTKPHNAKAAGIGALIAVIAGMGFGIPFFSFFFQFFH
jgi:uncharacterized membrane protein YvbJ